MVLLFFFARLTILPIDRGKALLDVWGGGGGEHANPSKHDLPHSLPSPTEHVHERERESSRSIIGKEGGGE